MSVESVVVSVTELNNLVAKVADAELQKELKPHADRMMRIIFDHCVQKNRRKLPKTAAPVVQPMSAESVPSLADAAARKLNNPKSLF